MSLKRKYDCRRTIRRRFYLFARAIYLIPVLPLIYLLSAARLTHDEKVAQDRFKSIIHVIVVILMVCEFAGNIPCHFSSINPVFGGSKRMPIALNDSNFDYEQELFNIPSSLRGSGLMNPRVLINIGSATESYRDMGENGCENRFPHQMKKFWNECLSIIKVLNATLSIRDSTKPCCLFREACTIPNHGARSTAH